MLAILIAWSNPRIPGLPRNRWVVFLGDAPKRPLAPSPIDLGWIAANGGLGDGGLRNSEDIRGKRPFSSVFWISEMLSAPSGKGRKRQKKGEKGRFRPISGKGGQTPLKPPFVTTPICGNPIGGNPGIRGLYQAIRIARLCLLPPLAYRL